MYIYTYVHVRTHVHASRDHRAYHGASMLDHTLDSTFFFEKGGTPPKKMEDMMEDPPKNGVMALWPNTRVVKCKMFHKNKMGSIIRSSGTVFHSLLNLNSRLWGTPKKKDGEKDGGNGGASMCDDMLDHICETKAAMLDHAYIHTHLHTNL